MSDRLDRIEAILEGHGLVMVGLRTRQEVTQNHLDRIDGAIERLTDKIDRTNTLIVDLANVVYTMANRQDDHENRINRLEPQINQSRP